MGWEVGGHGRGNRGGNQHYRPFEKRQEKPTT